MAKSNKQSLEDILATLRAKKAASSQLSEVIQQELPIAEHTGIQYNPEQQAFIDKVLSGEDCVLIGAAGTGKTTCTNGAISSLIQSGKVTPYLHNGPAHKHLIEGSPGVVAVSFTNRAVQNLKKNVPTDLAHNCLTIHKLLEYKPVYYEEFDPITGKTVRKRVFEPSRNALNPLSNHIQVIIIDESSMVSLELFNTLCAALHHRVQFIFLGDIQQLPPVFGSAILGYKMISLAENTIELTRVYRQALESPIIAFLHKILAGAPIPHSDFPALNKPGDLYINYLAKPLDELNTLITYSHFFKKMYENEKYNPKEDIILIPFGKAVGSIELNKHIASFLAAKENRVVQEVRASYIKHYFSVGDKVLYEKEDAIITSISANTQYCGPDTISGTDLDYWGHSRSNTSHSSTSGEYDLDKVLESFSGDNEDEERQKQASHVITLRLVGNASEGDEDSEENTISLNTTSEIMGLQLGYAITVHKSQGSQWRQVFVLIHKTHATMTMRELLYTACSRAQKSLYIICEKDTFIKGIEKQKIKGNTLMEKAEFFKGKIEVLENE